MNTRTLDYQRTLKTSKSEAPFQYVLFDAGAAEGNSGMRDVLWGKGPGLADTTNAGLPVPPGFTFQTEVCREYMGVTLSSEVMKQMEHALVRLEKLQGQRFSEAGHLSARPVRRARPGRREHADPDGGKQGDGRPASIFRSESGEHGGKPESVKFCHRAWFDYLSCSPSRLLAARLARWLGNKVFNPDLRTGGAK